MVVDVDVSYRPLGDRLHVGVRRSPLREPAAVAALAERISQDPHLTFAGLQAYEAHLAGIPDVDPLAPVRCCRQARAEGSRPRARAGAAAAPSSTSSRGAASPCLSSTAAAPAASPGRPTIRPSPRSPLGPASSTATSSTATTGSPSSPPPSSPSRSRAAPAPASSRARAAASSPPAAPGPDRLPRPYLPEGLALLGLEGAGEVQTPSAVPSGVRLDLGDPVVLPSCQGRRARRALRVVCADPRGSDRGEGADVPGDGAVLLLSVAAHMHSPPWQVIPAGHTIPQPPQLDASVPYGSTHADLQHTPSAGPPPCGWQA